MSERTTGATDSAGTPRTVVVTGGNSGLGYACAQVILGSGDGPWHVVIASRDAARAQAAVDALAADAAAGNSVEAMALDLASLASVRSFGTELTGRLRAGELPVLHAVVCNAGVQMGANDARTADGFESTFGVNHLGHFALVNELLPALKAPARVVVVSSDTHDPGPRGLAPAWNDPPALARGELGQAAAKDNALTRGQRRYCTSKLANIYFTYALARRLPEGVTANAFNPGMMLDTALGRSMPAPVRFALEHVLPRFTWLLRRVLTDNIHTAEESGRALAWVTTAPELAGTTGRYFDGRRDVRSSEESYDAARAEQLWDDSLVLTGTTTAP
ncbi:SDR family NAD(P)-dependent oxidoreductase [Saccharopolyspora dendranthemae]|uniref:NAD(P)-dependent dehydrogenase (Short-subunit alcohol dehydrogenase family) n=1 Tax=Saccharopolyspora dendranthemae TaxID=1181886 RepID=A0A561TZT0_9PSEU|nr:SDR family NAD(P)-dependent oxidoreductase [Saccharopolyspora dendranthemae]TWF92604.1 NAD(P)-dependent dehydrogenase (short-subunit alcohol dehydrogenase family) [Saccharopolyspora dendranthemae]